MYEIFKYVGGDINTVKEFFMAIETKVERVNDPSKQNSVMAEWADFGWEGTPQEHFSESVRRTQETDKHYASEYKETTHFVTITFKRDTSMQNYKELVELEKQYRATLPPAPSKFAKEEPKRMGCLWVILAIVGIFVTFGIGTVAIILWRLLSYKKRVAKWEQEKAQFEKDIAPVIATYEEAKKKRADARQKAKTLV